MDCKYMALKFDLFQLYIIYKLIHSFYNIAK